MSRFWDRLRENARTIVAKEHAALQRQTCSPEYCLEQKDRDMMRMRQSLLDEFNGDIQRLKQDSCRSRMLALGTVLFLEPKMIFKMN